MDRRDYLTTVGVAFTGTLAGCLTTPERSQPRPFGETQHRNNVAMAAESVVVTDTISMTTGARQPDRYEQFALIRFWAENLVDSRRVLPPTSTTNLRIEGSTYTYESDHSFEDRRRQYEGGEVGPGVLRHGLLPFEVPAYDSNPDATFQISDAIDGFKSPVLWSTKLTPD